jgi:hypothetical protein
MVACTSTILLRAEDCRIVPTKMHEWFHDIEYDQRDASDRSPSMDQSIFGGVLCRFIAQTDSLWHKEKNEFKNEYNSIALTASESIDLNIRNWLHLLCKLRSHNFQITFFLPFSRATRQLPPRSPSAKTPPPPCHHLQNPLALAPL